ncbi:MAG: acylneuraminate cytidylyltransferase family protein [Saprospiraceae bacterium]|nr:acylneuraminate cytidylyltransferase family protein [Saprospiraceae bacterium]
MPRKNFRPFGGTTLTDLAIQQALGANSVTDIVVSSDSEEVLRIASSFNRVIALARPIEISDDDSPAVDYVRHSLEVMEKLYGKIYDAIVILQPSSPLRHAGDIDKTVELLAAHPEADSAVSVVKVDHMVHPVKLKLMKGDELLPWLEEEKGRFAAQDLPDIYVRNCAVYATWTATIPNRNDVIGWRSVGYLMQPETSVDINTMLDFEFAEYLFLKQKTQ